jgi:Heavy metal associated domain 2
MSVVGHVAHHIPGRLRIRIPEAKGRQDILREIAREVASAKGVSAVRPNPVVGSIVIQYDPDIYSDLHALGSTWNEGKTSLSLEVRRARTRSSRNESVSFDTPSVAGRNIAAFFAALDQDVRRLTANEIDLRVMLPLVAAGLGILIYLRPPKATPLWLTLMIFAFHSFLTLHGVAMAEDGGVGALAGGAADES